MVRCLKLKTNPLSEGWFFDLRKEIIDEGGDGSYARGFLMQSFKNMSYEERDKVENVFYGIVSFEPYTCYYSK